jgi:hypothetical protein
MFDRRALFSLFHYSFFLLRWIVAIQVVAAPLLLLGLYMITIDCTSRCCGYVADEQVKASMATKTRKREERQQERKEMDSARQLGRNVFETASLGGMGMGMGDVAGGMELVATSAEVVTNPNDATASEKENGSKKGDDSIDTVVDIKDVNMQEHHPKSANANATHNLKISLVRLETVETTDDVIQTLQTICTLIGDHSILKTTDKKMVIIQKAKEKKARNQKLWTPEVAVEFRKVLSQFSILASMGIEPNVVTGGLRQLSAQLKNPFRRSNSSKEEEAEKEDD